MMTIKAVATLIALIACISVLMSAMSLTSSDYGIKAITPGIMLVMSSVLTFVTSFVCMIFIILALEKWRSVAHPTIKSSIRLLSISTGCSLASYILLIMDMPIALIIILAAYILDTIAFVRLKDSQALSIDERQGASKLFQSQMYLLAGVVILFIYFIYFTLDLAATASQYANIDDETVPLRALTEVKTMVIGISAITIITAGCYYIFQVWGWDIMAKSSTNDTNTDR